MEIQKNSLYMRTWEPRRRQIPAQFDSPPNNSHYKEPNIPHQQVTIAKIHHTRLVPEITEEYKTHFSSVSPQPNELYLRTGRELRGIWKRRRRRYGSRGGESSSRGSLWTRKTNLRGNGFPGSCRGTKRRRSANPEGSATAVLEQARWKTGRTGFPTTRRSPSNPTTAWTENSWVGGAPVVS